MGGLETPNSGADSVATKSLTWMPYAKPTRRIHDSGFRMFEVGYILVDDTKKVVLYSGTDAISQDLGGLLRSEEKFLLRMDMNREGYIRFFTFEGALKWRNWVGSDASLLLGEWQPKADDDIVYLHNPPKEDVTV